MQTVGIPVFQFGIFSETDLSFFAGPDFGFGGRVHTNGNLFLASGATLTLNDRVSARGEVIRTNLSNGWSTNSGYSGNVRLITTPNTYRNLARTEGSLTGTVGSSANEPAWSNLSIGTSHGNVRNGRTGARRLNLPLVTIGATPIEILRRPPPAEAADSPLFALRYFGMASLRILISDSAADITNLPTVTGGAPVELGASLPAWYTVDAAHPPFAVSKAETENISQLGQHGAYDQPGSPLLGGFLKVDMQDQFGAWHDVTQEILSLGIAGLNTSVAGCTNPSPDAVIRLQRVRDDPSTAPGNRCGTGVVLPGRDFSPNVLYDTREGDLRDTEATTQTLVYLGGAMHLVELDMANLRRWFRGDIGASGPQAMNTTGYVVYFSDGGGIGTTLPARRRIPATRTS